MRLWMILVLGLLTSPLVAQETFQTLFNELATAINEQDLDKMNGLFAKEFSFTTTDQVSIGSAEELKDYYAKMLGGERAPVKSMKVTAVELDLVRELNPTTMLCRGRGSAAFDLATGESFTFDTVWTGTLVQEDGAWKFAALHGGIHYFDNPVMKKYADAMTSTGVIAGFVGMLMGFLFALLAFVRKKKPAK